MSLYTSCWRRTVTHASQGINQIMATDRSQSSVRDEATMNEYNNIDYIGYREIVHNTRRQDV